MDFNDSAFQKKSPQEFSFFFVLRISFFDRQALFFSHVKRLVNIFLPMSFTSIYLPRSARPIVRPNPIFALRKKSACSPSAVNDSNKTYSRSAVALLVRNVSHVCGGVARNL